MKRILLIDGLGSCFYHFHSHDVDKLPYLFTKNLREIIASIKPDKTFFLMEGGSKYRLTIYPEYKWARKAKRAKYTEAEKAEYDKFLKAVNETSELLGKLGVESLRLQGAEADDLAGLLCTVLPSEEVQVCLLTEDSDWSQLLTRKNTVTGSYKAITKGGLTLGKDMWLNYRSYSEEKGMTPEQAFDCKHLSGDTSDSILGVPGLGDASAVKLVKKYGSFDGVMKNKACLDVPRFPSKAQMAILEPASDAILELGFKLMNLCWSKDEWKEVLGVDEGWIDEQVAKISKPSLIDEEAFLETAYEYGWLEMTEPSFFTPFYSK